MSDQRGFSNDRTKPTGPRKSNEGDDYTKKKSEDVAHGGMVSNVKKTAIQGNWGIRHVHPDWDTTSPWHKEIILRQAPVHAFSLASDPCFISFLAPTPNF